MNAEEIREARLTAIALVRAWALGGQVDILFATYKGSMEALVLALGTIAAAMVVPLASERGITAKELLDSFTEWAVSDAGGMPGTEL